MRFLTFNGSPTKILLPSAEEPMVADQARAILVAGDPLTGCVISGLDLAGARLTRLLLQNCIVEDANWANLTVDEVQLDRVVIADSSLVGFHPDTLKVAGTLFDTCRFDMGILSGLQASDTTAFVECSLREADLAGASAPGCTFHRCQLEGADLAGAHMEGADLRESDLGGVRGLSTLRRVVLSPAQLSDLLIGVQHDLRLEVNESAAGPSWGWREAPET